jgi:lactoylglutathione lyase
LRDDRQQGHAMRRGSARASPSEFFKTAVRRRHSIPDMAKIEMTLGWVIAYVDDPAAAAAFYEGTFGMRKDFVVPGEYAQMDTGPTKLGFATYALARGNFDGGVHPAGSDGPPPNVEIALVAEDVDAAYRAALAAGCERLAAPADKPRGQCVGYVRDPFGMLVELATPL